MKQQKIRMPSSEGGLLHYQIGQTDSVIILSPWTVVGICAAVIVALLVAPLFI